MSTKFVELHIIQNFGPACLNRDDTNTPKDCEFGGVRHARISSQCLKRAIRHEFPNYLQEDNLGSRTKLLWDLLSKNLIKAKKAEEDIDTLLKVLIPQLISKLDGRKTAVLLFLGADEIDRILNILTKNWDKLLTPAKKDDKLPADLLKEFEKILENGSKASDIALFGRMMAEQPKYNQEASCQVAHAISTNAISMEWDFYTAVDDLNPKEETGAGMMGVIGYNSSCFYRYSVLDLQTLVDNLQGDEDLVKRTTEAFLSASIDAIPSAKQNSFAAHNPPSLVFAVVRESGAPIALTNAFEKPASPNYQQSLLENSLTKLDDYWGKMFKVYGAKGISKLCYFAVDETDFIHLPKDAVVGSKDQLVKQVLDQVKLPKRSE